MSLDGNVESVPSQPAQRMVKDDQLTASLCTTDEYWESALEELPSNVQGAVCALRDSNDIKLKVVVLEALSRVSAEAAHHILEKARAMAADGKLLNPDGYVFSNCQGPHASAPAEEEGTRGWRSGSTHSSSSQADSSNASSHYAWAPSAAVVPTSSWVTNCSASTCDAAEQTPQQSANHDQQWEERGPPQSSVVQQPGVFQQPGTPLRTRLARDNSLEGQLQARCLFQARRDARTFAAFFLLKAFCYFLLAVGIGGSFAWYVLTSGTTNYMVMYLIWALIAVVTGLLMRAWAAWLEGLSQWSDACRVRVIIHASESSAEFKAVGKYLEACGMTGPRVRLHIEQDEDDVEQVRFHYSPWAESFTMHGCIYGTTGEPASIVFRHFCLSRYFPGRCAKMCLSCAGRSEQAHAHFEVEYNKSADWGSGGRQRMAGDTITISVPDHHAEAIENLIVRAHAAYTLPRVSKVEVYSAAASGDAHPSWEFMQYISPLAPERTGRMTYVPSEAFFQIDDEYKRVVSIGNESLAVLLTGASRAGKSAMVTALAFRLGLPVYNLNLKSKFLTNGGVDALFSHRSIPHRPVLVHIEEFSMMFQETITRINGDSLQRLAGDDGNTDVGTGTLAQAKVCYEGLQSGSALNCSDLLKLFDQSGTTSPKRIFFVLTCIELPEQFDKVKELQPLLAKGRIQHFHLEDPTDEVVLRFLLQYFHHDSRRKSLSDAERRRLEEYASKMKKYLGPESKNWHSIKKYAEIYPLSN